MAVATGAVIEGAGSTAGTAVVAVAAGAFAGAAFAAGAFAGAAFAAGAFAVGVDFDAGVRLGAAEPSGVLSVTKVVSSVGDSRKPIRRRRRPGRVG
jgi:hypothetical protein